MEHALTHGAARNPALTDDIAAFIESGVSIIVGVVGQNGRAVPGRALSARVMPDGRIRLTLAEEGNSPVIQSAQAGGPVAVTFSAPISHRTLQVKGYTSRTEQPEASDTASAHQQTQAFGAVLAAIGFSHAFVQAFCDVRRSPLHVFSFPAQEVFEQTPGPGAGRSL